MLAAEIAKFACVAAADFGKPVVPLVEISKAIASFGSRLVALMKLYTNNLLFAIIENFIYREILKFAWLT